MFERLRRACASNQSRRIALVTLLIVASAGPLIAVPREGYSKVTIANRYLFAQPNASAPAPVLLNGLDAEVLEVYDDSTLARVHRGSLNSLTQRARDPRVEVRLYDEYDTVHVNGLVIDTRVGLSRSLPDAKRDGPYETHRAGSWVIQFAGPMKRAWVERVASEGVVLVQYLPFNAFIAAGTTPSIQAVAKLPFVQFVEQLHKFMKPSINQTTGPVELWIQLAETSETDDAISFLQSLSREQIVHDSWSDVEHRVEGTFAATDVAAILKEPLVIAVTERPRIALSDERVSISLTTLTPGVPSSGAKYKKWLADICSNCGNLNSEGYRIGLADTGLDGGSHAAATNGQISGEPAASGNHRVELPSSRVIYGESFAQETGFWPGTLNEFPDTTETKHDVYGHGTLVAGIAAGDPGVAGPTDTDGFYRGLGVAPSGGLVITKIDNSRIGVPTSSPVRDITRDAYTRQAFIQNHSYNQYPRPETEKPPGEGPCWSRYDGFYSTLSRDFDEAVRDADRLSPGHQPIFLTVSAGNVDSLPFNRPPEGCPDRFLTLPPGTAKNVLALGMAENVRSDSDQWRCLHALAEDHSNIASSTKTGTATAGWYKPDLMAVATSITSARSYDIYPPQAPGFCSNAANLPSLPQESIASTGTSFAAPAAAAAALLASRYYARYLVDRGIAAGPSTASPALLKAMLIAGAVTMRGGRDRSRVLSWHPNSSIYREGDEVLPRISNGHVYRAMSSGFTGPTEPQWPTASGAEIDDTHGTNPMRWKEVGPETAVEAFPNSRQGFGRLHLGEVLSSSPARDFVNQTEPLASEENWSAIYKVDDPLRPVKVALVWTDPPKAISSGSAIPGHPLVNNLDLSVEFGTPCTTRFQGNRLSQTEESIPDNGCIGGQFDTINNVEMARFFAGAGSQFTVRVKATTVTATGSTVEGKQDFALVVLNAYRANLPPPPAVPANFSAYPVSGTAVELSWSASAGATMYEVQRSSGIDDPYVTVMTPSAAGTYTDNVPSSGVFLYRVRASNVTGTSEFTAADLATTLMFSDDPLSAGQTVVRAVHITELRSAISMVRAAAGLTAYPWTDASIQPGLTLVKSAHVGELRLALDAARLALGLTAPAYQDPVLTSSVVVRAVHVSELRERVK